MKDWTESQNPPPSWNKDIYDCDSDFGTILTAVVRRCYMNHLKSALEQNYTLCSDIKSNNSTDIIENHVLKLERKALQECMVASLYQKAMLSMIRSIKQSTFEKKLCGKLCEDLKDASCEAFPVSSPSHEVGPFLTPPADYPTQVQTKCNSSEKLTAHIPEESPLIKDENMILSECSSLSHASEKRNEEFGNSESHDTSGASEPSYDWNLIEKEMARVCGLMFSGSDSDLGNMLMEDNSAPPSKCVNSDTVPSSHFHPLAESYDWEALRVKHEEELNKWWTELEKSASLEKQAKIKRRIIELFGEDELTLADAHCDITEKEASQYRERIAPWIVKHLMPLYKEKRIASRFLFKKLARHIADCLIFRNHFPDECDVWMAVQEFFQHGKGISTEADIFY